VLASREKGTGVLTISATSGGHPLWSKELDAVRDVGKEPYLGAIAGTVVVAGYDLRDKDHLVWFGFDPGTGSELYRVREESTWSSSFLHVKEGSDRLYAYWGAGMHVYEPKTGKMLRCIGEGR
jgi:hypothetical protein